jgi:hypothetical protein
MLHTNDRISNHTGREHLSIHDAITIFCILLYSAEAKYLLRSSRVCIFLIGALFTENIYCRLTDEDSKVEIVKTTFLTVQKIECMEILYKSAMIDFLENHQILSASKIHSYRIL